MKNTEKLKSIPVVMMSADDTADVIANCMNAGACDYLVKPLRVPMLKEVAKHVNKKEKDTNTSSAFN